MLDVKMDELATRFENMLTSKLKDLEEKFEWFEAKVSNMEKEIKDLKTDYNASLEYVDQTLSGKISNAWEFALQNEQYSRKNSIRIFGLKEDQEENLEEKVINFAKDDLDVELHKE